MLYPIELWVHSRLESTRRVGSAQGIIRAASVLVLGTGGRMRGSIPAPLNAICFPVYPPLAFRLFATFGRGVESSERMNRQSVKEDEGKVSRFPGYRSGYRR